MAGPKSPDQSLADAVYATYATGHISSAVTDDFRLFLDLQAAGLDWRAYTGQPRIPRWRLRVNGWYLGQAAAVEAAKHPPKG